jgi:hypothetical protein
MALGVATAAEQLLDFTSTPAGKLPETFKTFVAGEGPPPDWQIVMEDVPSELPPVSANAKANNRRSVLAQLSREKIDERFPVAFYNGDIYGDFTFTTRFKLVEGSGEQIAGVVFRLQDEKNFYVARANALDGNVRFYKFVNGERTTPVGNNLKVAKDVWHELQVECTGNRVIVRLNGKEAIPPLNDNSFSTGKLGFITKSDAVSYFADAKVVYRPIITLAQSLVQATLADQPRLLNLRVYGSTPQKATLHVLAAKEVKDLGLAATDLESKVLAENQLYVGKTRSAFIVTAPVRDRNGEAMGVVQFFLKPFTGQTEANAAARVEVILKAMQLRVGAARSLVED